MFRPPSLFRRHRGELTSPNQETTDPFFRLQDEMNRLFDDAFTGFSSPSLFGGNDNGARNVRIDVHETDKAIEIEAELPGVAEEDIDVELTDNLLTIRGEKKYERSDEKDGEVRTMERAYGSFSRSMSLPFDVDPDAVEAAFKNGLLKLTLPKPPETIARSKKISINRGE